MSIFKGDIDIDVASRDEALKSVRHVRAMIRTKDDKEQVHNVGIYVQDIPANPITGMATFEYKIAEELGYQKIDVLNNSIYEEVEDEAHLDALCEECMVQWDLMEHEEFVDQLPHLTGHFDIVNSIRPRNVDDLAVALAIIRPAKRHLVGRSRIDIDKEIWDKPADGGYHFKRAHSYAYAMSLVVKMNLITEKIY